MEKPTTPQGIKEKLDAMYDLVFYADGQLVHHRNKKDIHCIVEVEPSFPWRFRLIYYECIWGCNWVALGGHAL